jgi:uncharacterized protein YcaQ
VYAVREPTPAPADAAERDARLDALVDLLVAKYAPLPARTLGQLLSLLMGGVPQCRDERAATLARARARLPLAQVEGVDWRWPAGENPSSQRHRIDDTLRLLAPFDPIVWDRHRFELLWGWAYRFEAYTPPAKRQLGHYALPMLWRGRVIGWGNLAVRNGRLQAELGYVAGKAPRDAIFRQALDAELDAVRTFLGLAG